ncbi:MAG: hypothetical protein HOH86_00545 [Verrucomicrobiales bacterium]|nr:hypothetical protein [Verrucomicrobiales bacterium]
MRSITFFFAIALSCPAFGQAKWEIIQLGKISAYSNPLELKLRLSAAENPGAFDIRKEKYTLLVPDGVGAKTRCGLFIWINAGDAPTIPRAWEPVMTKHKLIFIGAHNSGNPRNVFDRFRLAIEAAVQLKQRYNVDPKRIYISGFSGGGRCASMLGVAYPDVFSGAMPFMGVNFYKDVTAQSGKKFRLNYIPHRELLAIAKKDSRYVLVTGTKDFNRINTQAVFAQGFKKEKFANAFYLEVPKLAHALPGPEWLEKGIGLLDGDKPITPPRQ